MIVLEFVLLYVVSAIIMVLTGMLTMWLARKFD